MKVAIINVPTKVGIRGWTGCIRAVLARRPAVAGINEAFTGRARALFVAAAAARGYRQYGARQTPNLIFWRRRHWQLVSGRVHQLHDRLSRYAEWRGFNDARYVTEVILRRRGRKHRDAPQVAVLCTHWVPGGDKVEATDRAQARDTSVAVIRGLILEHLAAGRVVILIGDLNVYAPIDLGVAGFEWVRGQGVDKIGVAVPAGYRLTAADFDLFAAPTDHGHGVAARIQIRRAG